MDDIAALRPTIFIGVPRILERVADQAQGKISKLGIVPRLLFKVLFA